MNAISIKKTDNGTVSVLACPVRGEDGISVYHEIAEEENMIYTRNKLKDGTVVCSPVTAGNTYTRCAECGKEIPIDLRELIFARAENPYGTDINCAECTDKMMRMSDISFDAVARLVDALDDLGYSLVIGELFGDFDIEDVRELIPEECELFVDDLLGKVLEVRHDGE